jgi:glutamyl-tRNA synthetase
MVDFLFLEAPAIDPASWDKVMKTETSAPMLDGAIKAYADAPWDADTLKAALEMVGESVGLKLGKAQAPVRVATTGRTVGPPLFESLVVLGRERTLERLRAARARV